jgi:hypothetical protein
MSAGKCSCCNRRFKSKSAREAAENYHAIHAALRSETSQPISPEKRDRHLEASRMFKATGATQ